MDILKADYQSPEAAKLFAASLRNTGFGVVTHHPISRALIEQCYADWRNFFASETKNNFTFDKRSQAGYFPFRSENAKDNPVKDLKEFFHIFPTNLYSEAVSSATRDLYQQLLSLGRTLLTWLDEETPTEIKKHFSMPLAEMFKDSPQNLFRIIHYPPLTGKEEPGAVRAAAHEDINLITLLPASTAMGLQVKNARGEWQDVPGNFGDIVINVGDMLQMCSDGYYVSTTHRVINPEGVESQKPRYSMPLFVHPRPEVQLSSQLSAGAYLHQRLEEIGLK